MKKSHENRWKSQIFSENRWMTYCFFIFNRKTNHFYPGMQIFVDKNIFFSPNFWKISECKNSFFNTFFKFFCFFIFWRILMWEFFSVLFSDYYLIAEILTSTKSVANTKININQNSIFATRCILTYLDF